MRVQHDIMPVPSHRTKDASNRSFIPKAIVPPAELDVFEGGRPKGKDGRRWEEDEEEWKRMQEDLQKAPAEPTALAPEEKTKAKGKKKKPAGGAANPKEVPLDSDSDDSFTGPFMPTRQATSAWQWKGKSRCVTRYMLAKSKHREAVQERRQWEGKLNELKVELGGVRKELERGLEAVLVRELG